MGTPLSVGKRTAPKGVDLVEATGKSIKSKSK
jgi:hypothetical protein